MNKSNISSSALHELLEKLGCDLSVYEAHGILTGMMACGRNFLKSKEDFKDSVATGLAIDKPTSAQWKVIENFMALLRTSLSCTNFSFQLVLPDDEDGLADRVEALGLWATGFLAGVSLMGVNEDDFTEDLSEIIDDIIGIANISSDIDVDDEDDELNFFELVEFVRLSVQNVYMEFNESKSGFVH